MKRAFGIILLLIGLTSLPGLFVPSAAEAIGRLIAMTILFFLPAYFLLRNKKNKNEGEKK